ncbi:MAG: 3-deoxy-8-phosphooctulonate synthase [Planctomycetales bacterium]|nr:3-deoxy-8-phosphooctulonate synthase [Planctomycetales bacterium]
MARPVAAAAPTPVPVGSLQLGGGGPLFVIAGPCVIESEDLILSTAKELQKIAAAEGVPLVFKSSYDKANRSSIESFRGPGLEKGLAILARVRKETGLPVLSDVHTAEEARAAAKVLDILQIPAFLCRQTDLLLAAAGTGKPVNVKKGQFMAPWDMGNVLKKLASKGRGGVFLTERGASFGYNNLVADMRAIPVMRALGVNVIYDAGHSLQLPGGLGNRSGGNRDLIEPLARAAVAAGADGIFLEVHPDPDKALSDGPNSFKLSEFARLLRVLRRIREAVQGA